MQVIWLMRGRNGSRRGENGSHQAKNISGEAKTGHGLHIGPRIGNGSQEVKWQGRAKTQVKMAKSVKNRVWDRMSDKQAKNGPKSSENGPKRTAGPSPTGAPMGPRGPAHGAGT